MKIPYRSPVGDDLLYVPAKSNWGAGFLALLTAAAFVAVCTGSVQFHQPVAKANDSGDNQQGGSGVPGQAGYNPVYHREEENYGRSVQVVNVPYGMFPPAVAQYVTGARSVPYGVYAMVKRDKPCQGGNWVVLDHGRVYACNKLPHVRVAARRPLNVLPAIAVSTRRPITDDRCNLPSAGCDEGRRDTGSGKLLAPQSKMPTFASTLFGIQ